MGRLKLGRGVFQLKFIGVRPSPQRRAPLNNGLPENYHQIFKCLENRHKFDMTANIKIVHNGLQIRPLQVTS